MILGLDPGRDKTGFAVAGMDGALIMSGIFPSRCADSFWEAVTGGKYLKPEILALWLLEGQGARTPERFALNSVAVGNGTCGGALLSEARRRVSCPVAEVDERGTTYEARGLYWRLHRPAWWQMILPRGLRVPPRMLDDLAAWAIALRSL